LWSIGLVLILLARASARSVWVKPFGGSWAGRFEALSPRRRRIIRRILRQADGLFPQTSEFASFLRDRVLNSDTQVVLLPNFVRHTGREPSFPEEVLGSRRFAYVGQIKEEKGVFVVLDALPRVSRARCDFWGPILPRDRERFLRRVEEVDGAHYFGEARPNKVPGIIGDCAALLLPTFHTGEGLPGAILEAFAAARPAIVTRWKELPEIVRDGENGLLVPPREPAALADAMSSLLANFERWRKLGRCAYRTAESYGERRIMDEILVKTIVDRMPAQRA